jgi:hypothetical protein
MLLATQLIGFGAAASAGAGSSPTTSLSFRDSATSTAATITTPGTTIAGDLIVLWDFPSSSPSGPANILPSGYTQIATVASGARRGSACYKIADSGDANAVVTGMDGALNDRKIMVVFAGDNPISSAVLASVNSESTAGDPVAQTITSSSGIVPLVVLGFYGTNTGTLDPRSFSPASTGEVANGTICYVNYKLYNSAPANITVNMEDEGSANTLVSCYISVG